MESGERIFLPDMTSGQVEWRFRLQELTDAETAKLDDFFTAAQGQFGSFLFIDPMANLLGWSEDFSRPDWQAGLLAVSPGAVDPLGMHRASTLNNGSAGTQALQQTLAVPGDYVACFSMWCRSTVAGTVTLTRDTRTATYPVGPAWKRLSLSGAGTGGAIQSSFSIALGAGQAIDVFGLQVEAQPYASLYKPTTSALGIYEETYFGVDELKITSTGAGLSSCEIVLSARV
jgi:hypothetical protein